MQIKPDWIACMRIDCPHWFEDKGFVNWLNNHRGLATWHVPDEPTGDCSDVFLVYDHGECSDFTATCVPVPEHIAKEVREICQSNHFNYGVLWITNLPED